MKTLKKCGLIVIVLSTLMLLFVDIRSTTDRLVIFACYGYYVVITLNLKWFEVVRASKEVVKWCDRRINAVDDNF